MLITSTMLNATITVTPVGNYVFTSPAGNQLIDLDNDGTPDFEIDAYQVGIANEVQFKRLHLDAETSTAMAATVDVVNAKYLGENFIQWYASHDSYIYQIPEFMTLVDAGYKYIGVRLNKNGNYHYGWVQIKVFYSSVIVVDIVNYAYEDIPNTPIAPGQTVSATTSINEVNNSILNIYPNPVKHKLHITSVAETKINSVKIYSVAGSLVKEANLKDNQIDMSDLNSGIYYAKIMTENREIVKKIIKE
jgi:hypothetical protein